MSPSDNSSDVAVGSNIVLTFNEAVKAGAGSIQIRKSDGTLVQTIAVTDAGQVSFSDNQITINPSADLSPGTSYYVTLSSGVIRDLANNPFAGISNPAFFNFTTNTVYLDTTAPIVLFTTPSGGITGNTDITVTFNEPVKAGGGAIEIRSAADDSLARTISVNDSTQVTFSGRTVMINPSTDLGSGEFYIVLASGAITDVHGNEYDGVSSVAAFMANAGVIATAVGTFGATAYGASASAINQGTISSASADAYAMAITQHASATAIAVTAVATAYDFGPGHIVAGNDVAIDMTGWNYDAALNGTLVAVSPTQVDILGTDGRTYRFFGITFNTAATSVADVGGALVRMVEVWAGSGADAHVVHVEYNRFSSLQDIAAFGVTNMGGDGKIIGSSDDDILFGFEWDDALVGRGGNDVLRGNEGDDHLLGGLGADTLHGDEDEDTFVFIALDHLDEDTIADLTYEDKIDLSAINGLSFIGANAFSGVAGQVRYSWSGGNTTLQIDRDGNGVSDASLLMSGAQFSLGETAPGSKILVVTGITPLPGLVLTGTAFSNTLTGGAGNDVITGLGRGDRLTGGGGSDKFVYAAASHSTSKNYDTIADFNTSADLIDLWFQVTGVDTAGGGGSLGTRRFDSDLASAVGAAKLAGHHAILFTPTAGNLANSTFLIVDVNGVAGYQANVDLVILLGAASSLTGLTAADFV